MRVLVVLLVVLAGCSKPLPAEAPEAIVAAPVPWQDGLWWTYDVTDADGTRSVTFSVDRDVTMRLDVSERQLARSLVQGRVPVIGVFTLAFEALRTDFEEGLFDPEPVESSFSWFQWPLREGDSWAMESDLPQHVAVVRDIHGSNATIEYDARGFWALATFDASVRWFTNITFEGAYEGAWVLTGHGADSTEEAWRVEPRGQHVTQLGTLSWGGVETRGATDALLEFRLACDTAGFSNFRLGPGTGSLPDEVVYQDICPATATRTLWLDVSTWEYVRIEAEGAQASPVLDLGNARLALYRVALVAGG